MTTKQLRELIEKDHSGKISDSELASVKNEWEVLIKKRNEGTISREEEILLWMIVKECDYTEADRIAAIMHGDFKPGKDNEGNYID